MMLAQQRHQSLFPAIISTVLGQTVRQHIGHLSVNRGRNFSSNASRILSPWSRRSTRSTEGNSSVTSSGPLSEASSASGNSISRELSQFRTWNESGNPSYVITRFESMYGVRHPGTWDTIDTKLVLEYLKALAKTQQLERMMSPSPGVSPLQGGAVAMPEFRLSLDDSKKPIQVSLRETRESLFRELLKHAIGTLLALAALSILIETAASNLPKGLGLDGDKKIHTVKNITTSFKDVKGCNEVKAELQEIVSYLTDPGKFTRLGAKLPKGVLLSGPPGTGKTLLARAIAGEAKVPFLQASGSDFEEMFVGVGARRIRDLFAAAKKVAPAIIFIDEIDAVGSQRGYKGNTSLHMTLNQLLVELDGFEQNDGVVVICATNFAESLDSALTRPGRLDKTVVVPLPDLQGRQEILDLYGSKVALDEKVDLSVMARRTAGMTGADLFNVINIAAVKSSAEGKSSISMDSIEQAFDRVVAGLERANPMAEEERRMTAFHEAGHTLVSWYSKSGRKVHKATIMPRGEALGITWEIPTAERYSQKLCELEDQLKVLMGGKAAEVLIYGIENVTAGCTSDLRSATLLARNMVMKFGMAMEGTMYIDQKSYGALSNGLRSRVDLAVQKLLDEAYTAAMNLLTERREELQKIADALVEFETISHDEILLVLDGKGNTIAQIRSKTKEDTEKRGVTAALRRLAGRRTTAGNLPSDSS